MFIINLLLKANRCEGWMFQADLSPCPPLLAQDRNVEEDSQHSWTASNRSLLRKHLCTFGLFDPLGHENKHLKERHISVTFIFPRARLLLLHVRWQVPMAWSILWQRQGPGDRTTGDFMSSSCSSARRAPGQSGITPGT